SIVPNLLFVRPPPGHPPDTQVQPTSGGRNGTHWQRQSASLPAPRRRTRQRPASAPDSYHDVPPLRRVECWLACIRCTGSVSLACPRVRGVLAAQRRSSIISTTVLCPLDIHSSRTRRSLASYHRSWGASFMTL